MNQFVENMLGQTVGCHLGGLVFSNVYHSDDIAILASSLMGIQVLLGSIAKLIGGFCLKANISKPRYLVLKRSRTVIHPTPVKLLE